MENRPPRLLRREEWARDPALWKGMVEGQDLGTGVTVLFFSTDAPGGGAALHMHPYDEVFIVREERVRYTIGDTRIEAEAGDVVFGPAGVPHKFVNLGRGRLETTDIHLSDRLIQTDLPDLEG